MAGNNQVNKNQKKNHSIFSFFTEVLQIIHWERYSAPGQANLISVLVLAAIIVVYLLYNGFEAVARVIASIWNSAMTEKSGDSIISLLVVFISAFAVCLFVIWITRKEIEKNDEER